LGEIFLTSTQLRIWASNQRELGQIIMTNESEDTVVRRALEFADEEGLARQRLLRKVAADLELASNVLEALPAKRPNVWGAQEWHQDLTDLRGACEQLRKQALELRHLADELSSGSWTGESGGP
jgi:hypothetical protein